MDEKLESLKKEMVNSMYDLLNELYKKDANLINYPKYLPSFDDFINDIEKIEFIKE